MAATPDSAWDSSDTGPRRSSRAKKSRQRSVAVKGIPDTLPAFLRKTYFMLEHPEEFGQCIRWSEDGAVVVIDKVRDLGAKLLCPVI